jgi:N-acetylmuramoyl-L-alanine amidase
MRINRIVIAFIILVVGLLSVNARPSLSQVSLSKELGLKVKTIYIDPSYGGNERGPLLAGKEHGKQTVLLLAQNLQTLLIDSGFAVYLSRDNDRFVTLDERVMRSRSLGTDIYLRIKVSLRNEDCIRLFITHLPKERETKQKSEAKTLNELNGELDQILRALQADDRNEHSLRLALSLISSLEARQIVDCIRMQQIFDYILLNTAMPAVTIDFGVSQQSKKLPYVVDVKEQNNIVRALAAAITSYADERP